MPTAIERAGFLVTDIEILRPHYADTLKTWRERFLARHGEVAHLYDERFCRLWELYLVSSEMPFREEETMVFQIQMTKMQGVVPNIRDYIVKNETYLRSKEANPVRTDERETKGYQLRHDNDSTRRKISQLLGHATKQQP